MEKAWRAGPRRGARRYGFHHGMAARPVLSRGSAPDMDVYDGAAVSAPFPLSADSVAKGSMPIKIPDFTRGKWQEKRDTLV